MNRPAPRDIGETLPAAPSGRPASCANGSVSISGLAGFLLSLVLMHGSSLTPVHRSLIALAAAILPMVLLDVIILRVHRRPSTGLVWTQNRTWSWKDRLVLERVAVKLLGLAATISAIAICYWLFPVYQDRFYRPYWMALREIGPWLIAGTVPYFFYVDRRMSEPRDGYWHAGMAVLGRFERVDRALLWQHALGWIIKGYFLPLMFVYLTSVIGQVFDASFWRRETSFMPFYGLAWDIAFAIDLVFATLGYCLTFRVLDSHIRSSDPTFFGWAVALVCYQPFSAFFFNRYLDYQDNSVWSSWLADMPVLQMLWGSVTLGLLAIHAWSVLIFGCRFSNLTHRGILTHGPFRLTKHPSYLSKNLVWWLVSIPFISTAGFDEAVRNCLLLLGVNLIYFLRARTEERHLSQDPTYAAYALWIEKNGALRSVGHIFPALRYAPPPHALRK
jgi:isoprenylcysteine carboxyl methyltransferase (ICMT) family protein YpbQ